LEIFFARGDDASEEFHNGEDARGTVVALGNFDGVHLGHRRLLEEAAALASRDGLRPCVFCFRGHTDETLRPGEPVRYLTSVEERAALFEQAGMQAAIFEDFPRVCGMPVPEFIEKILLGRLRCGHAVCGFDYRFGRGGEGDANFLRDSLAGHGAGCTVVAPVTVGEQIVSSTLIRQYIEEGDMPAAVAMLGRPYSIRTPVVHGQGLGGTLGIPTVNQRFPAGRAIPARGVYVCECDFGAGLRRGVCNVGTRPTVSDTAEITCETHILDFDGDLYGRTVEIRFLRRLRDERKFSGIEELRERIMRDIESAKRFQITDNSACGRFLGQ